MNLPAGAPLGAVMAQRRHLLVRGLVQGVGFRPHVYRTALRHGVSGYVNNGPDGVVIEVEGADVQGFIDSLQRDAPILARIDTIVTTPIAAVGSAGFEIRATTQGGPPSAAIPADTGLCQDCLEELFDPGNRRYLHPFIACTNCGPRFTMTRRLPYDRDSTTMADFTLCPDCAAEYVNPESRRFHAEPIACHDCGPRLSHTIDAIAETVKAGGIVAIKGIGGFHLACDAHRHEAVTALRTRKRRDAKPFAVMVPNVASARNWTCVDEACASALTGPERPVVIMPRTEQALRLSPDLSPGLNTLGLLLPYTAIHYLLLHALLDKPAGDDWLRDASDIALVMTSANLSGDPLITDNAEAATALADIADLVVDHDRVIATRADDSVIRVVDNQPLLIRRARGYVPGAIELAQDGPCTIAMGAHLKNSITITRGPVAWVSQHIGDLDSPATVEFLEHTVEGLRAMLLAEPALIACDLHPDYASTRIAERLAAELDLPLHRVQHHHAHIGAVMAEHRRESPVLGIALDGHGLGADGGAWGGELLRVDGATCERLGHFAPLGAPGGDAAAREPWRMAAAVLHSLGRGAEIPDRFSEQPLAPALRDLLDGGDIPTTTAAGRLFDTAAGLLGVSARAAFEGEPPMHLEGLVQTLRPLTDGYSLSDGVLDFTPLLAALSDCNDPVVGAEWLHGTLVEALVDWTVDAASRSGLDTVALAGGCLLNRFLAAELPRRLQAEGLKTLAARRVPPNDGSISLGQAWVAQRSANQTTEVSS